MQLDLKIQINTDRERGGNFFRLIHLTKGFAQELERGRRGSRIEGLERREYIRFFSFYFFPHSLFLGFPSLFPLFLYNFVSPLGSRAIETGIEKVRNHP
jgi:hypothetical protein